MPLIRLLITWSEVALMHFRPEDGGSNFLRKVVFTYKSMLRSTQQANIDIFTVVTSLSQECIHFLPYMVLFVFKQDIQSLLGNCVIMTVDTLRKSSSKHARYGQIINARISI
jgi:hypothetical protein